MINNQSVHLALRNRALSLSVCTTGSLSLSATATGFARAAGSFVTDGFLVGMELTASGFVVAGNNGSFVITAVTALALSCANTTVDAAAAGRTLLVGLPALRAFENVDLIPVAGRPYVEEEYVPATNAMLTFPAQSATVEETGLYIVKWYGLSNTGISAIRKSVDALKALFAPGTTLTAASGDVVWARATIAATTGQMIPLTGGWSALVLTVPWLARSTNTVAP